ncbi:MAG: hypothetical protein VX438_16445 [Planctomycetota bacterium]|nr:hypothetical protein [Planctomycetota bacterium]
MEEHENNHSLTLRDLLPSLEFKNPFSQRSLLNESTAFLPLHFEKNYSYPLFIWLSGSNSGDRQLARVMPKISLRNYIGVAPEICTQPHEPSALADAVFECIDQACLRYNINTQRIFIAGGETGGSDALQLALNHPDHFAGAISLCGCLPNSEAILGHIRTTRKTPLFIAQSRDDHSFDEDLFCDNLKTLHVGGFSVTARQYPGTGSINDQMLHDVDVWTMEVINGYDMTTSDQAPTEWN